MPYISNMFYIAQMSADKLVLVLVHEGAGAQERKGTGHKGTDQRPAECQAASPDRNFQKLMR